MFIGFEAIGKRFARRAGRAAEQVVAIADLSLGVARGEMLALVGPSGSGKTTLLRCLAGLEAPDAGRILIDGVAMFDAAQGVNVPAERRDVGLIFQSYALWPHLTVARNVAYPLHRRRLPAGEIAARVAAYLELVQCGGLAARYPHELSGGQQQRVALARALVYRPAVLLFDEPLSNLDPVLRVELRMQIRALQRELGFTGVYVTHDQEEAFYIGDQVALLGMGRLVQAGAPDAIYRRPASPGVARFVGATNAATGMLDAQGGFSAPGLGALALPDHVVRPAAGHCLLLARPEDILLEPPQPGMPQARVQDRALLGAAEEYFLQIPDGPAWRARLPVHAPRFAVGEVVGLRVNAALLFPAA